MDDIIGTRYVTIEAEFEYMKRLITKYKTRRTCLRPCQMKEITRLYEVMMFSTCSLVLTGILQNLLSQLEEVYPEYYVELRETSAEDYHSTLLYDCLAIACEKNHDSVVRILLDFVIWKPTDTTSTICGRHDWSKGCTLLHCAAANGDVGIATMLIQHGVDVNQTTSDGETALHVAYDAATAEVLLTNGADVNALNRKGKTPLYCACASYRLGVIRKLLDNGAKTDLGSLFGPENIACKWNDDRSIASVLLQLGFSGDGKKKVSGPDTCIIDAIRYRHYNGKAHYYSMCSTCKNENLPMIEELLAVIANVDVDCSNYPPLHLAILDNHKKKADTGVVDVEMVKLILSESDDAVVNALNGFGTTALFLAVERNLFEVAELLLDNGADPNLTTSGDYPLVIACRYLSHEFVKLLLDRGADPNVVDCHDKSPLFVAVESYDHFLVSLLVEHGADVNYRDKNENTALHRILDYEQLRLCPFSKVNWVKIFKYLLDNGFNVNISRHSSTLMDAASWQIIHPEADRNRFARESRRYQIFQLLLECRADVSVYTLTGSIRWDCQYVLREMMRHLRDLNLTDPDEEDYQSLLMTACSQSDGRSAHILLAAGADPNLVNSDWLASIGCPFGVCQAMVIAGHRIQPQQLKVIDKDIGGCVNCDLMRWLEEDLSTPPSLFRLSRTAVRRHLSGVSGGRTILPLIHVLPVPDVIKLYLRFEGPLSEIDLNVSDGSCNCTSCAPLWIPSDDSDYSDADENLNNQA